VYCAVRAELLSVSFSLFIYIYIYIYIYIVKRYGVMERRIHDVYCIGKETQRLVCVIYIRERYR
jgi:hypothetical protein